MYEVVRMEHYFHTFEEKEVMGEYKTEEEAQKSADFFNSKLPKNLVRDGKMWYAVKNVEVEDNKSFFQSLTEEQKNDIIEVDGKKYIRAIYEKNHK